MRTIAVALLLVFAFAAGAGAEPTACPDGALPASSEDLRGALDRASAAFHDGDFESAAAICRQALEPVVAGCGPFDQEAASAARDIAAMLLWSSDRGGVAGVEADEALVARVVAHLPDGEPEATAFPPSVLDRYEALRPAIAEAGSATEAAPAGTEAAAEVAAEPIGPGAPDAGGADGSAASDWTPLIASTLIFAGAALAAGGAVEISDASERRALADRAAMPADSDRMIAEAGDLEIAGWTMIGIGAAAAVGAAAWWIAGIVFESPIDDTPLPVEASPMVGPGAVGIVVGVPLEAL